MAPKSILKNKQPVAGPSRQNGKSKGKMSVSASVPKPAKGRVQIQRPVKEVDSEDDNDFGDEEMDTDEEIEASHTTEPRQPAKRKRVTTAADFGATLTTLLSESSRPLKKSKGKSRAEVEEVETKKEKKNAAAPILALSAKPLPPTRAAETLERRAARAIKAEKAERLDRARVMDVVEGWTPAEGAQVGSQEFERGLRKTAQRGVIKLFNAILVASKNAEAAATTLAQQAGIKPEAPKNRKEKDNILGRGAQEQLTSESFLDLVRRGGAK